MTTKLTAADLRMVAEWLAADYERAKAAGLVRTRRAWPSRTMGVCEAYGDPRCVGKCRDPRDCSAAPAHLVRYFDTPGYLSSQQTRERDNAIASRSFTKDCAR